VIVVVMVGAGALILWMAKAAARGRLGRNPVAGIRLPVTMASDRAWLVAHQAARRPTEAAGWCAIVFAVPSVFPVPLVVVVASILLGAVMMLALILLGAAVGARAAGALEDGG
jgi:hypothetical protein